MFSVRLSQPLKDDASRILTNSTQNSPLGFNPSMYLDFFFRFFHSIYYEHIFIFGMKFLDFFFPASLRVLGVDSSGVVNILPDFCFNTAVESSGLACISISTFPHFFLDFGKKEQKLKITPIFFFRVLIFLRR